jgi:hypothetical protein
VVLLVRTRSLVETCGGRLVYALDDAYIHMAVADNLAKHGSWGLNPGEFANASSSLLWTLLLALASLLGAGDLGPLVLGVLSALLLLALGDRLLRAGEVPPGFRLGVLLTAVLVVPLPAMILSGMEHVLHAALALALILSAERVGTERPGAALVVTSALVPMARFEGLFLVALVCLWLLRRNQTRWALGCALAGALPLACWGVGSLAQGWMWLPNSVILNSSLGAGPLLEWPGALWDRLVEDWRTTPVIPVLVAAVWMLSPRTDRATGLYVGMAIAHLVLARFGWFYRYEAYLVAIGVLVGGRSLWRLHATSGLRPAWICGLVVCAGFLADRAGAVAGSLPERVTGTWHGHLHAAEFLQEHYADQAVASTEAGAISQVDGPRFVDLAGLGHMGFARELLGGGLQVRSMEALLEEESVPVVVVFRPFFPGSGMVSPPPSWILAGTWRDTAERSSKELLFFARSETAAVRLRENLADFESSLPTGVTLLLEEEGAIDLSTLRLVGAGGVRDHRLEIYANATFSLQAPRDGALSVQVSGSQVDGQGPRFRVLKNGSPLGPAHHEATASTTWLALGEVSEGDLVAVHYFNDETGEDGSDRNLYVWGVRIGG